MFGLDLISYGFQWFIVRVEYNVNIWSDIKPYSFEIFASGVPPFISIQLVSM